MTFKNRIQFTIYFMCKKPFRLIFHVVMMTGICMLLFVVLCMHDLSYSARRSMESTLEIPLDQVGTILIEVDDDNSKRTACIQELIDQPYVKALGNCLAGSFGNAYEELAARQNSLVKDRYEYWDFIGLPNQPMCYYTNGSVMEAMGIKLYAGSIVSEQRLRELINNGYTGIYLGYSYRDIEVETEYESQQGKCIVLGILDENSTWLSQNVLLGDYQYNSNLSVELDNLFLVAEPIEYLGIPAVIGFHGEKNFDEGMVKIQEIAEHYNVHVYGESFDVLASRSEDKDRRTRLMLAILFVALSIVFILLLAKMQILFIMSNRYEYGVLLASGADLTDLCKMIIWEVVFKLIIALPIATLIGFLYVIKQYGIGEAFLHTVLHVVLHVTMWKYLLLSGITATLAVIGPVFYIRRINPVTLLAE